MAFVVIGVIALFLGQGAQSQTAVTVQPGKFEEHMQTMIFVHDHVGRPLPAPAIYLSQHF